MIGARLGQATRYAYYSDPVVRRALAQLRTFTDWLAANNVQGYIGEFGWPWNQDSAAWNNVARAYLRRLRQMGLPHTVYASSGHLHTNLLGQYTDLGGAGDPRIITTPRPASAVSEAYAERGSYSVTIPDPDFGVGTLPSNGGLFSNFNPGTIGTDYFYPSAADLQFLAARGVKIIRLTFQWERLQPTLSGALNSAELTRITTALAAMASLGMQAILTPHNFAGYKIGTSNSTMTQYYLTTDTAQPLHVGHFTDLWTRLSTALKNNPALYAYALMNEPTGITAITGPYGPNLVGSGTFEAGLESWSGTGTTIAQSPTQAHSGSKSLAFTVTSAGNSGAFSPSFAVTTGGSYAASCYVRAGTLARTTAINIDWHDSANTYLSSSSGTQVTDSLASWTQLSVTGTAPANAAKANITIKAYSSVTNEVTYIDDVIMQASTNESAPQIWEAISQSALNAIRANADSTLVLVPGYDFSHAYNWPVNHPAGWITDSANNFRYEAHHYWDTNHSGTYVNSYAQESANAAAAGY